MAFPVLKKDSPIKITYNLATKSSDPEFKLYVEPNISTFIDVADFFYKGTKNILEIISETELPKSYCK